MADEFSLRDSAFFIAYLLMLWLNHRRDSLVNTRNNESV